MKWTKLYKMFKIMLLKRGNGIVNVLGPIGDSIEIKRNSKKEPAVEIEVYFLRTKSVKLK